MSTYSTGRMCEIGLLDCGHYGILIDSIPSELRDYNLWGKRVAVVAEDELKRLYAAAGEFNSATTEGGAK